MESDKRRGSRYAFGLAQTRLRLDRNLAGCVRAESSPRCGMRTQNRQRTGAPATLRSSPQTSFVSSAEEQGPRRITLPNDLSGSLKYLDDTELQKLLDAATLELKRRRAAKTPSISDQAVHSEAPISKEGIPEAKRNLVRASFKAGLKPAAIARTFRLSPSLVNRIIKDG